MKTLTKDEIKKLRPDQQDSIAQLELAKLERRQRLLNEARGKGKFSWLPVVLAATTGMLPFLVVFGTGALDWQTRLVLVIGLSFAFSMLTGVVGYMDKRLNSLIDLLGLDTEG